MLEGRLGDISLLDILHLLTTTAKTGRLSIARRDGVAHVDVREGQVLDVVVPENAVPENAVPAAAARTDESLVDRLTDLLRCHEGRFRFEGPGVQPAAPETPHRDPVFEEARARLREWPRLLSRLGGESAVFHLACPADGVPVTLSAERWRLATLVDGRRTVADVVALAGIGTFRGHHGLVDLLDAGLVAGETPPTATNARGLRTRIRPERLAGDDVPDVDIALIERLIHGVERL